MNENERQHVAGIPHVKKLWGMILCRLCYGLTVEEIDKATDLAEKEFSKPLPKVL